MGVHHEPVDIFRTNPKQGLQLLLLIATAVWQSMSAVIAVIIYLSFIKTRLISVRVIISVTLAALSLTLYTDYMGQNHHITLVDVVLRGFALNWLFWKWYFTQGIVWTIQQYLVQTFNPTLCFSLILSMLYSLIDCINLTPHQAAFEALEEGRLATYSQPKDKKVEQLLNKVDQINDSKLDGAVIGVSYSTHEMVIIPDSDINQVALVLGTTGAGKTITLRRFYRRSLLKGYPLIVVNGKPTEEDTDWLRQFAKRYGRFFYGFNCANFYHYNSLAHGSFTELKDKLISLKDQWENEYYRTIAENYLQTTFAVLQKSDEFIDLVQVAACLDFDVLVERAREVDDSKLNGQIKQLVKYEQKDIKGLQAHLNLLIHSELGQYFEHSKNMFSLKEAFAEKAIIHFALPALKYPSFSSVLGKLVINDIKTAIESNGSEERIFCVFDEFSIFAGKQSLNLVNMGRGKGVHAIFGTQGLGEIEQVDPTFTRQLLNCVNTIICHRLNDHQSAEAISTWIGTKEAHAVTAQIKKNNKEAEIGTIRKTREFIIHPDEIKQTLAPGEAFYVSKIGFKRDRIKVKYS